ncbi:MAG: lysine--tRNA ligase [Candidatus Pacearchaeota archaeon]
MKDKFFWADQIADEIIKENKGKKEFVCASGITPSGIVHIGNFREVITTDLVVRSLKDKGKKVRFIYSWDDFDRFRKVPSNIPKSMIKEYENYIGMPVSEIPSPFVKGKSYAQYFEEVFEKEIKQVGIKPEFIRQNIMNKKHKYSELIKKAVDGRKEIIKILNKYRKEDLKKDWMPFNVYCQKCKKDSTKIIGVEGYFIEYECPPCREKDKIDYRKEGLVKLVWRVDWPARWSYEGVEFEPGGIDHSADGGSFTTSKEVVKKIYDFKVPKYTFYEWVRIKGGTEFSSSTGNALSLGEVSEIYEPEVLRYLFVGTRPNKGFAISFDNDVIKIYDDFDDLERRYFDKKVNPQEKRIYELSVLKLGKKRKEKTSFRHLTTLVQIGKMEGLSKEDKIRAKKVKNWLEKYAPDEMKFEFQEKIKIELTDKEKLSLNLLKDSLKKKKLKTPDDLLNEFYNISQEAEIQTKEFFQTAYQVLIGKTRGPRLADLILFIGKEKIIKLLELIK